MNDAPPRAADSSSAGPAARIGRKALLIARDPPRLAEPRTINPHSRSAGDGGRTSPGPDSLAPYPLRDPASTACASGDPSSLIHTIPPRSAKRDRIASERKAFAAVDPSGLKRCAGPTEHRRHRGPRLAPFDATRRLRLRRGVPDRKSAICRQVRSVPTCSRAKSSATGSRSCTAERDLDPLDRVDAKINVELHVDFKHIDRKARLVGDRFEQDLLDRCVSRRRSESSGGRRLRVGAADTAGPFLQERRRCLEACRACRFLRARRRRMPGSRS